MGCGASKNRSPASPASQKCLREGCSYKQHTSQGHGFCCNLCKMQGDHGPLCERQHHGGAKPAAVNSGEAPKPQVPPVTKVAYGERASLKWEPSLVFGPNAVGAGTPMTATETMHIEAHKGQLFASFGKWMSPEFVKKQGDYKPFISKLASAGGQWVLDMCDQGLSKHALRLTCLKSITFSRDCEGKDITPVQLLTACYSLGKHGNCMMFRVDDDDRAPGTQQKWQDCNYTGQRKTDNGGSGTARAVLVHRDDQTGVDRIFALEGMLGVMSGVYDPRSGAAGRVTWDKAPEKLDLSSVGNGKAKQLPFRPLSLVVCNGRLFMSSASWILERQDGPTPVWKGVIDISKIRNDGTLAEEVGGIRGMTAVQSPTGNGSSILFCWNPNSTSKSWILRCDFDEKTKQLTQPVEETSINAEAKKYLQTEELAYTLAAYNNMLPSQVGKHQCNLIGFEIVAIGGALKKLQLDQPKKTHAYWAGGGIACRVNEKDYFVIEVGGAGGTGQALTAVRCFANSPFPEEPKTIYFGGYDCNSFPSNHTAWIWKCTPNCKLLVITRG